MTRARTRLGPLLGVAVGLGLLIVGAGRSQTVAGSGRTFARAPTAPAFLVAPLTNASPEVARGRYLAITGDCVACHTSPGATPFAGGRPIHTPFGVIYSSNLTSDRHTGVGRYTPDTFWRAMHQGVNAEGANLYPAFPYTYFTRVSREDSDALLAYLRTIPAVDRRPPANALPFPLNLRVMVSAWNLLFFRPAAWSERPSRAAQWNRGAYLVETLGHCGACHSPKNALGADEAGRAMEGGVLDNWAAPDLTGQTRFGLGGWSEADIVEYLKTGRNVRAAAGGAMSEVVSDSTSLMRDDDLQAIAVYLKSLPASPRVEVRPADSQAMRAGEAIYVDACSGCHRNDGQGLARYFPPLPRHAGLQQRDGATVVRVILEGARTAPTPTAPTPLSMPSFAWKLNDEEIADVATYVRNAWGNQAAQIDPGQVKRMRRTLDPQRLRTLR